MFVGLDPCEGAGIIVSDSSGTSESPGYHSDGSGEYGANLNCRWTITAEQGKVGGLTFDP